MSGKKVSEFTAVTSAQSADELYVINGGNSRKITAANLADTMPVTVSAGATSPLSTYLATIPDTKITPTGGTTARTLADRFADVINVKDYGATGDGTTDDTSAIQAAIDAAEAAGGGLVSIPAGTYACSSTLTVEAESVAVVGAVRGAATILDFTGQASGPGLAVGGSFDWRLENLLVRNAAGDGIEINNGTATGGAHTFAAYFQIRNVAVKSNGGNGITFAQCYMGNIENLRAQSNTGNGINIPGFCTSLRFVSSHGLTNAGDGWNVQNITYSTLISCGSDSNTEHGYWFENLNSVSCISCGSENNQKAAFYTLWDGTGGTVSRVQGLRLENCTTNSDNAGGADSAYFLFANASTPASDAGAIQIIGCREIVAGTGNAFKIDGSYDVTMDRATELSGSIGTVGFAKLFNGATDFGSKDAINVSASPIAVATIRPANRNGVGSMGGLVVVSVQKDAWATGSRHATYLLLIDRSAAGGSSISTIASLGDTAGANANDPSFTWNLTSGNPPTLTVATVGSTSTGTFYFHFSAIGDVHITPS